MHDRLLPGLTALGFGRAAAPRAIEQLRRADGPVRWNAPIESLLHAATQMPTWGVLPFRDVGSPFPLFDAPFEDAADDLGAGVCTLCHRTAAMRFALGIGCAVMVDCASCGATNGLDADDRVDGACRACQARLPFPEAPDELACCDACLRTGRAAITKDTELGMVSWEQAFEGMTHGVPGLNHPDFEMVPTDSDWVRARVAPDILFELLRTPTYSTLQGELWLFCCRQPMVFKGSWSREMFSRSAPDRDGRALLADALGSDVPGLWEAELHDETGIYVFRCSSCDRLRAHWDVA